MRQPTPTSSSRWATALLVALAFTLAASPAAAELYTIQLDNGTEFTMNYPPREATWDPETVLVLTEGGNWVGIERASIVGLTIETERLGNGERINPTTLFMGQAPNDLALPEEGGEANDIDRLLQAIEGRYDNQNYTVEQFAEPTEAGTGGGIPSGYLQQTSGSQLQPNVTPQLFSVGGGGGGEN